MRRDLSIWTVLLAATLPAAAYANVEKLPGTFRNGVLSDQKGMTLYVSNQDAPKSDNSSCYGPCAANWAPLKASLKSRSIGDWAVIVRKDQSRQWTYKGKPVYLWIHDRKPGDATGDGFNHIWHVVRP